MAEDFLARFERVCPGDRGDRAGPAGMRDDSDARALAVGGRLGDRARLKRVLDGLREILDRPIAR